MCIPFQLRSIFVVLSDDLFRQILRKFEKNKSGSGSRQDTPAGQVSAPVQSTSGNSASAATDQTIPPPSAPAYSSKGSKSKSLKRNASVESLGPTAKK